MKMKGISFKSLKIIEAGQVEECCGQVAHEVYLADGQVEILTFFSSRATPQSNVVCVISNTVSSF